MLAAIGVAWLWWSGGEVAPPAVHAAEGGGGTENATDPACGSSMGHVGERGVRDEVGAAAPAPAEQRFWCEVLDAVDQPVEGATVEVWPARGEAREPDAEDSRAMVWLGPDRSGSPLVTGTTGPDGRCEFDVLRERVYVTAAHPDLGRSIARAVGPYELGSYRVLQQWLLRPVTIRGVVLDANTRPLPFAIVRDWLVEKPLGRLRPTGEVAAGSDGRFEFEVAVGAPCKLSARHWDTSTELLDVVAGKDLDVVLAVSGAFSILAGSPGAGGLMSFVAVSPDDRLAALIGPRMRCSSDRVRGTELAEARVPGPGTYRVYGHLWTKEPGPLGGLPERVTSPVDVVVSVTDPHPTVVLGPVQEHPQPAPTPTRPHATLNGTVFLPDGGPCTAFDVEWSGGAMGVQRIPSRATIDGNTFRYDGELPDAGIRLVVRPEDPLLAACTFGPFPGGGIHDFVVRLPEPAEVCVHVFVHGRPARALQVGFARSDGSTGANDTVDAAGAVQLRAQSPGPGKLYVQRDREVLRTLDVELQPGRNRDIVVDIQP